MRVRFGALTLLVLLAVAVPVWAHRLEATFKVLLPEKKVRIESWFDITEDPAKGAKVKVLRGDDSVLAEGQIDEKGFFTFDFAKPEALRVVVTADDGHRHELPIPETAFQPSAAPTKRDHEMSVSIRDVVSGVALLLALAAFVLSWRNARQLRALRKSALPPNGQAG